MAKALTGPEKLQALADLENKLIKHEIEIKGIDFTFWTKPTTISDYKAAKAASRDPEDLLETAARLFIKNALDQGGQPQYAIDSLPMLLRVLSMTSASKLISALNDNEEEETDLDMKSAEAGA
jgi:hypothetical protein